jgi:transposase
MRNVSSIKSKPRSGRPPKTDEEKDEQLAEAAMAALTQPLRELNKKCSSGKSNAYG